MSKGGSGRRKAKRPKLGRQKKRVLLGYVGIMRWRLVYCLMNGMMSATACMFMRDQ